MITAPGLLGDCQRLVRLLEEDLRDRLAEHSDLDAQVRGEHERARGGKRTGQSYGLWRDEYLTQVAVHWVLAAVFVRFLEDNLLLADAWLSGSGPRRAEAQDRQERFFARQPAASDRDYLLACFREVERLPAMDPLFDERHNPLFRLGPTADGARAIVELWRRLDASTGELLHDFADPSWGTRFLGDLYQDLSEAARKRFALLQTPEFVEEFLLDRTLEPAMAEFGYQNVRLIDPACGSGHFLLGAFHRLFKRWQRDEPGTNDRELARRALEHVVGVDLNPFAVAIARFRLLIAALMVSGITRLADAPAFPLNLATGDSLLHGPRPGDLRARSRHIFGEDPLAHVYETEDADDLRRLLCQQYHVVVGNPPYITPKDPAMNLAYRDRFGSCHRKYSLAIPFTERFFDLALSAESGQPLKAGWVGMITANSFMKREFGKKLVEKYMPRWDLTHVIDTAGAYIPGHGTPTVILIARNRLPVAETVRTVMGIRGEPATPENPAKGLVWTAIARQVDLPNSQGEFVSVADLPLQRFHQHPWSLGGGGASELKAYIESISDDRLGKRVRSIGFASFTGTDEAFLADPHTFSRKALEFDASRLLVYGEAIRDWSMTSEVAAITPYDTKLEPIAFEPASAWGRYLWPLRTTVGSVVSFGGRTRLELGESWWTWYRWVAEKLRVPLSLAFAFVATHNHFVLDRGGKVFKQSAPVIKLPAGATEDDHLALLGLLNSSAACFWMKQAFFNRGSTVDQKGARQRTIPFEDFYEHDGTKLQGFPVLSSRTPTLARDLDQLAQVRALGAPRALLETSLPNRTTLDEARHRTESIDRQMIALQEELDWQVYRLYSLLENSLESEPTILPEVALGERAFEIALARKVASGEIETKWFERHGSTPITEIPARWPEPYRRLIERRLEAIAENPWIALIEQPEYKRRWNREPWEEQEQKALRAWLLDRMEDRRFWPEPRVASTGRLADRLRQDDEFRQVAALFGGREDFDWTELVTELALGEAIPFLAALRYADSGIRKRFEWEETWRLQRLEDAIDARVNLPDGDPLGLTAEGAKALKAREVGTIAVPAHYTAADFRRPTYWRLRGKLDVPKERFILYPGLERAADSNPVIGWAGWSLLEQAQALGIAYHDLREKEGWERDRLAPLLAGLLELLPWLKQWYNDPDTAHSGLRLGDYFAGFLDEEARTLDLTRDDLAAWRPQAAARRSRRPRGAMR